VSEAMSGNEAITVVLGCFEPIVGVADTALEQIVARHAPPLAHFSKTVEYELLVRVKVSQTRTGVIVPHDPAHLCGTMLLAARATSPSQSAPKIDILTSVRGAAHSEVACSGDEGDRVARVLPGARPLTDRETEVLELLSKECTNRQIADALQISVRTVGTHVPRIFRKLGVHSRRELFGVRAPERRN
jgi:DNA-binding CsgD family transcriptional regulator